MFLDGFVTQEEIKKERKKALELKKSQWWRQKIGPGICHHCNQKFEKSKLTMDHVIPISRGGKSSKNNVVVSCLECNQNKGHMFSVEKYFIEKELETSQSNAIKILES